MKVGIISTFVDYHRQGRHHRGVLQPQAGALIAALLPPDIDIEVVNDAWTDPDWRKDYDLLFISALHADFDRARQISHYWRRRGTKTVFGGTLASTHRELVAPWFDAIVVGDPESTVRRVYDDFCRGDLQPVYVAAPYDPLQVPTPRFDLLAQQQVLPLSLEVTRGCPYACEFCALTGLGTRHHVRPVELVVRDIVAGRRMLGRSAPWHQRRIVGFYDNNLGGNPGYLRRLCDALEPLRIWWGACVTFNVICEPELLACMARAGCRGVFVGLESFNAAALVEMRKSQNVLDKVRGAIDQCHRYGILVMAGIMLSPETDDADYIASIPRHLGEAGLHVPTYVSFETPLPGTPYFNRLAAAADPRLLPNAALADFNAYTLVTRPRHLGTEEFVGAYRDLSARVFSPRRRLRKLLFDLPRLALSGGPISLLYDAVELASESARPHPQRTYIAGTEPPPPELAQVPFGDDDFESEEQRSAILDPWHVTDAGGRVLPAWLAGQAVWGKRGHIALRPPRIPQPSASAPCLPVALPLTVAA